MNRLPHLSPKQRMLMLALRPTQQYLYGLAVACGWAQPVSLDSPEKMRAALRRRDRRARQLLPQLRALARRGLVHSDLIPAGALTVHASERSTWRLTKRGAALSRVFAGERRASDLRILGIQPRTQLPVGQPDFTQPMGIVDRVDDLFAELQQPDEEPWSDTSEWYWINDWVGLAWQRQKDSARRAEGPHIYGSGWVPAAERVFRRTGIRRVMIYRCLGERDRPNMDLEFVGVPCGPASPA